jgi:hypothetical protein
MTTQYFSECKTLDEAKKLYKELARANHPDIGGEVNGARVEWRAGENRIRVYFGKRVDLDTFKALKRHGFRVLRSEGEGAFSAYYNRNAADFIHNMKKGL